MRKLLITIIVMLLSVSVGAQAQITNPASTTFEILDPDGRDDLEFYGELEWKNVQGTMVRGVQIDVDSLKRGLVLLAPLVPSDERGWLVRGDSVAAGVTDTSTLYVTVETIGRRGKIPRAWRVDSLQYHPQGEVWNLSFFPGVDLLMDDSATADIAIGDTTVFWFLRRTFDPHAIRHLVLFPESTETDCLLYAGSQFVYGPVSNEYEYINLFVDAMTSNASTGARIGIGYQIKSNRFNEWMGDANDATRMEDTLFTIDADVTVVRGDWSAFKVTHINADSIRFIISEKSAKSYVLIRGIRIEQHN